MKRTKQISIRFVEETFNRIHKLSERTRYTPPQIIEMCVDAWLGKLESKLPTVAELLSDAHCEKRKAA
jgi:predicted DNA-binding protein